MQVAGWSALGVQGGASEKIQELQGQALTWEHQSLADWSPMVCGLDGSVPMRLSRKPIAVGTVRSRFGLAGNYGLVALV